MIKKPEKFRLYWLDDDHGKDFFVLSPAFADVEELYSYELAEDYHAMKNDIGLELFGGGVYADCGSKFVCDVPTHLVMNIYKSIPTQDDLDKRISLLTLSRTAHSKLLHRTEGAYDVLWELIPELPKTIKNIIFSAPNFVDKASTYFIENYEDREHLFYMLYDVYDVKDDDLLDKILYFLYLYRLSGIIKHYKNAYNYGCITPTKELLNKIDGMSLIVDIEGYDKKTYVYDGCVYQKGELVVNINRKKL